MIEHVIHLLVGSNEPMPLERAKYILNNTTTRILTTFEKITKSKKDK